MFNKVKSNKINSIKADFRGQRKDENVLLYLHKHPFTLFINLIRPLAGIIIIILVLIAYVYDNAALFSFLFTVLIFCFFWILYEWLCWWLDIYIISDQRIIDINQRSLFSKKVSEVSWDKIQDITYEVNGFFPTVFDYGSVIVQTAAATESIRLAGLSRPAEIKEFIARIQKNPAHFSTLVIEEKTGFSKKGIN